MFSRTATAIFYLACLCQTSVFAEPTGTHDATSHSKPNILLICVDDLKPQLGCYGDTIAKTPNIDRLATRGLRFDSAYCNQAVCSPSRNALMVGLRPQTLGIYDLGTNFRVSAPDAVTLPQYFMQHGYHTQALGKIFHVGHGNQEDVASWTVPHYRGSGSYALKENQAPPIPANVKKGSKAASNAPKGAAYESADVDDNSYADGQVAEEAVKRIEVAAQNPDQPFFMAVGFVKPHLPFCAPTKYWDLYDRENIPIATVTAPPAGAPSYAPQFGGELRNYRDIPAKDALEENLQRTLVHGYYAATSFMDAQVGRVLDALKQHGLDDNTIIVLWGDHGWHLGDHGMWCKHTNYEQAARIPVIIAAPGKSANANTSALIETVDIYPTLCELAGLPAPKSIDGISFASVVQNPTASTRDSIIHVYPRGSKLGRAIRTQRYRLVEWKDFKASEDQPEYELYDYQIDPLETENIAGAKANIVAELNAILAQHPAAKPQISTGNIASQSAQTTKPKQDRVAMFKKRDINRDGRLTKEEFLANQPDPDKAPDRFEIFDSDKSGDLTQDEFVFSGKKK